MSQRKQRVQHALTDEAGSGGILSTNLLQLAVHHLEEASADRGGEFTSSTNHYTPHTLGCVLLLIAGLESTINALVWFRVPRSELSLASPTNREMRAELEALLRSGSLLDKYRWLVDNPVAQMSDLVTLIDLRDDIVHGIPAVTQRGRPPLYLRRLEKRGLFLGAAELPDGTTHFVFTARLCSFKLAYWSFEVVEAVLESLVGHQRVLRAKLDKDLGTLRAFRTVPRPEQVLLDHPAAQHH